MPKNNALKIGVMTAGAGMAVFGFARYLQIRKAINMLTFSIPKIIFRDKGVEYLRLLMDVDVFNPSDKAFDLKLLTAKVFYGDTDIGYALPKEIHLAPGASQKIKDVEVRINLKRLGPFAWTLVTQPANNILATILPKISFRIFIKAFGLTDDFTIRMGESPKQIGLVASGKRKIKDGSKYNHLIVKPTGTTTLVDCNGNVDDTVYWAGQVVKQYHKDVKQLADYLKSKSSTKKELFENIFDFCYNHIQYHLDRQGREELRRPAMTWHDRKHGVDCDDFSIFIASILYNLDIPFELRITKYGGRPNFQHIYLIAPIGQGKHITIDPVLDTFNYEKPYSGHKDYDMKSLNLAGAGSLGIPIEILAGAGTANPERMSQKDVDELFKVVYGHDLQGVFSGLGSAEDDSQAMLRFLKRLRNVYVKHPKYIAPYQDPYQAVEMLDYAIKYWNTNKRQAALDELARKEDMLIARGDINLEGFDDGEGWEVDPNFSGTEPELAGYEYCYADELDDWQDDIGFTGVEPEQPGYEYAYESPKWEEDFSYTGTEPEDKAYRYDYSVDGLNGRGRRRRQARRATRRAKRVVRKTARRARRKTKGGVFKRIATGARKGIKKVARGVMKVSAAPMRIALLAALRANAGKVSDKLKYAYLSEQQAIARGIDRNEFRKLKAAHAKVENMFFKMGGNREALKRAILSGKRKHLRGFEELGGTLSGLSPLDGWEQDLGYTGNQAENPLFEYRYDNQYWEPDGQFSGTEPENPLFEYDYTFDGLSGRRLRFRRRRKPKRRWLRKLFYQKAKTKAGQPVKQYHTKKQKRQLSEAAGELLEAIQKELKTVQVEKLVKKAQVKRDFLEFLSMNSGHIATLLSFGLKTETQATTEGATIADYKQIKKALQAAYSAIKPYGGTQAEVNKAIELGKDKAGLDGLGSVAAAGAAAGLIGKIVGWIKNIKIKQKAKKEAKTNYTASGNTKEAWKQDGRKRFNQQWAEALKARAQATVPAPPPPVPGPVQAPVPMSAPMMQATPPVAPPSPANFMDIINDSLQKNQAAAPPAQGMFVSDTAIPGETIANPDPEKENFWKKHKKPLLIGGGLLTAGAIGYGIYRHYEKKKDEEADRPKSPTKQKALAGPGKEKKAAPKKAGAKTARQQPAKIKTVTLQ